MYYLDWNNRNLIFKTKTLLKFYKWKISNLLFKSPILNKDLRTKNGIRFLELKFLLDSFFTSRIKNNPEYAKIVSSQFLNVLMHCDHITYDEPGAADAYAMLHFLDRYHRFQIIFDALHKARLMPIKDKRIDILDVGTGPGPSMFAVSDFYSNTIPNITKKNDDWRLPGFSIDYVERSQQFRHWLHHFTEFVNACSISGKSWNVPYHHGTFCDFKNIEFNNLITKLEYDDDGDYFKTDVVNKHRFDLIVFSNFLTTVSQVRTHSKEIQDCVRNLRNNGILVIVGATSSSKKYKDVYTEVEQIITSGRYSNRRLNAYCNKIELSCSTFSYSWKDPWGNQLKGLIKSIYDSIRLEAPGSISSEATDKIIETIQPKYSKVINWEVFVFRKKAWPRSRMANSKISRVSNKSRSYT